GKPLDTVSLVLLLTDGNINTDTGEYPAISKFQPGDKLVKQMIGLFADQFPNGGKLLHGSRHSQLIGIYSASGGAGKTSVALGLAIALRKLGQRVFCLSLESLTTFTSALAATGNGAMTHLLLGLREAAPNLAVRLDRHKTTDPEHNLDYLEQPECSLELAEMTGEDVKRLLAELRNLGQYDSIVMDMDSAMDCRMLAALDCCDRIVLVQLPEPMSVFKTELFLKELSRTHRLDSRGNGEKLISVFNRCPGAILVRTQPKGLDKPFYLQAFPDLWSQSENGLNFDRDGSFTSSLAGVAKEIIRGNGGKHIAAVGK
ncbi:MAG TPA: AAA family ATPase, partial [Bacillota bacterium]|nr:AAA family ATPase [Bacillota bacterium]